MALDRGALAKIDRRILSELNRGAAVQLVKVPLSDAGWSTWRRYCEAIGLTMGEAIAGLVDYELRTVIDEGAAGGAPVFAGRAEEQLATRESDFAARESELEETEERLREWTERLRFWERELEAQEQRTELAFKLGAGARRASAKVGRNERCPCGSGLKHKHCHGLADR